VLSDVPLGGAPASLSTDGLKQCEQEPIENSVV
jgi:hypothetical protein